MEQRTDDLLRDFAQPGAPGAIAAVLRDGEIALVRAHGLADLEAGMPIDERTNFRLASVSKQFTAMAVMICRERGLLEYDDPITDYLPELPEIARQITIRHLLTHTSGIVAYEDLIPEGAAEQVHDQDVLDLVKTQLGTYHTPGTAYRYSNTGYALLALTVERVSGRSFATFLRENIFEPLGMDHTVAFEDGVSTVSHRAFGYRVSDEAIVFADQSRTSAVLGDGGIYSSAADYQRWDEALYTDRLVSRASLGEAFTDHPLPDGTLAGYGFGWRIEERGGMRFVTHNGSTSGFNNAVRRVPDRHLTVLVLTNRANGRAGEIADSLVDWILAQPADAPL
jgi:CubicO group peptidase (beta-lactamase class C family)